MCGLKKIKQIKHKKISPRILWLGSLKENVSVLIGSFFLNSIINPSAKSNLYGNSTYEQNNMISFSSPCKRNQPKAPSNFTDCMIEVTSTLLIMTYRQTTSA